MKMTKTTRFFFLYTLYFVLALGAYIFFYLHINNKAEAVAETQIRIAQLGKQNSQMQNLEHVIRDTKAGREQIGNYFVDSEKIIEFLETVESLGGVANVDVDVKSITEEETKIATVKELNLTIDFTGEWREVHHFLVLLESAPVKMTLDRLTLGERPENEEGIIVWRGNVSLRVLQLKK